MWWDVSVRMSPSRNMQDFKDLLLNVWAPEDKGQRSPGVCTLTAQSSCGSESLHNIQSVVSMLWLISSVKRFHVCVHAFVFFYIRTIITVNMKSAPRMHSSNSSDYTQSLTAFYTQFQMTMPQQELLMQRFSYRHPDHSSRAPKVLVQIYLCRQREKATFFSHTSHYALLWSYRASGGIEKWGTNQTVSVMTLYEIRLIYYESSCGFILDGSACQS